MALQLVFPKFTWAELEPTFLQRRVPRLVSPQPDPSSEVGLHEALAIVLRHEAAAIGLRLDDQLVRRCVTSLLWYALSWEGAICDLRAKDEAETPELEELPDQVAGIPPSGVTRWVLASDGFVPQALSEAQVRSEIEDDATPPFRTGVRYVDLARLGSWFAKQAGRPLVTIVGHAPHAGAGLSSTSA